MSKNSKDSKVANPQTAVHGRPDFIEEYFESKMEKIIADSEKEADGKRGEIEAHNFLESMMKSEEEAFNRR